jgi:type VI secretion system protein VasI
MIRRRVGLCAIALALGSLSAMSGAKAEDDPKSCAAIPKNDARLECYDLIFCNSAAAIQTTSAWLVKEETSKVDDSSNVFLYLDSSTPYQDRFGNAKNVTLTIACRERETNLWLSFDEFMSDNQGGGEVTYRIDKTPAKNKQFEASSNNHALGLWYGANAVGFAKKLFGANNLLIRATPFSESTIQVEFQIAGLEEAVAPLRKACNW